MIETLENTATRMAGDERRLQLIQVAMHLFSKHGFSGTTTKRIAEEAGVSEAMVFKHFASKEELYSDILDHKACSHGLTDPLNNVAAEMEAKDDFAVFYGIALNALNHHEEDTDFIRLLLHSALEGHDMTKMFFDRYVRVMYEKIGGYIAIRQKDNALREIDPNIVVRALSGMFIHHSLSNILIDTDRKILKISNEDAAKEFATILLNGIIKQDK